jgi:hypothetical protein
MTRSVASLRLLSGFIGTLSDMDRNRCPVSSESAIYVSHARSTSHDSVGGARYARAQEVRNDAKYKLPVGAHVIHSGDWNLFNGTGKNADFIGKPM